MRPKSANDPSPRRVPTTYFYEGGKPKDWNSIQAVKCLNDRRAQAIDRITMDAPWTRIEREYLASLCEEFPDASIWELTERHNARFKGQDFAVSIGFSFAKISQGRTVESVSHEYKTYKPYYNRGEAPGFVRYHNDNSLEGRATRKSRCVEISFGPASKALEKKWDEQGSPDAEKKVNGDSFAPSRLNKLPKTTEKATRKKRASKKDQVDDHKPKNSSMASMANQPQLEEFDEKLLEMAGAYNEDDIRSSSHSSSLSSAPSSPLDSPLDADLAVTLAPSPPNYSPSAIIPFPFNTVQDVEKTSEQIVREIVGQAIDFAEEQCALKRTHVEVTELIKDDQVSIPETVAESFQEGNIIQDSVVNTFIEVQLETESKEEASPMVQFQAARNIDVDENYSDDEEL